ncbi:MAG: hypothetical protein P8M22_03820 [Phycisphaerales bacterium]|nr:hypothetical protein [Phycisphaerales bacterium]
MNTGAGFYRNLQRLQERIWIRVLLSVIALGACAGYFIPILLFSYGAERDQSAIYEVLTGTEAETNQRKLRDTGKIYVDGRVFEVPPEFMPEIFDEEGTLTSPQLAVLIAMRPQVDSILSWAPRWLVMQPSTTWTVMCLLLLWLWLIIWIGLFVPFLITLVVTIVLYILTGWMGLTDLQWAIAGIGLLTFTFLLLIRLLLMVLAWPNQILAVAHTLIREASRTRLTLLFIIVILIMLPLLPLTLDPESHLRFQLQNFMSRSLEYTFALASIMTLLLACGTVAFEIRDRHIWHVMTKPVGHIQYLIGKWLGIVLLNACLLAVAGVSVFLYIQFLRTTSTSTGMAANEDRFIVAQELLAARSETRPTLQVLDEETIRLEIDRAISNDPAFARWKQDETLPMVREKMRRDFVETVERSQRSIPPGRNGQPGVGTFLFEGLDVAAQKQTPITLNYQFITMAADEHERYVAGFMFNRDKESVLLREYIPTVPQVVRIPSSLIQPDGTLEVTILNYFEPPPGRYYGQMFFEKGGLELLYKAGGFDANFVRVMLILLIKLGVLAALGVFFATFLNFPVACLTAFTIFIGGQMAPFLASSLEVYWPESTEKVDWQNVGQVVKWGFESSIRGLAQAMVFMLGAFGEYHPVSLLVEGRLVSWKSVLTSFLRLELIWGGLALVLGWVVLRSRQLAIYSGGQG